MLAIVLAYSDNSNILSSKNEQAIKQVLKQNNIYLNSDIPKDFSPMPTVELTYDDTNIEDLKNIFFGKDENVRRSVDGNATILKNNNSSLTIGNTKILYLNDECKGKARTLDFASAKSIADKFIEEKLNPQNFSFKFHSANNIGGIYHLKYYSTYKGYNMYSSYMQFDLTDKGILSIQISKYKLSGVLDTNRKICSSDEALFTFMHEIKSKDYGQDIYIESVELGYKLQEAARKGKENKAIPCYRIALKDISTIYYINAYTNSVME